MNAARTPTQHADSPLARLSHAHQDFAVMLTRLQSMVDALALGSIEAPQRQTAAEACTFFSGHARAHHAEEEARVFPDLLNLGDAELAAHVRRLQQDHGWIEENWIELEPQLDALAHGWSGFDMDETRHAASVFIDLVREHIALEDSTVYPAAQRREAVQVHGRQSRASG